MEILKQTKEPNAPWQPTTEEECIQLTEGKDGKGCWRRDTVLDMLEDGHIVQTPWSRFKKKAV